MGKQDAVLQTTVLAMGLPNPAAQLSLGELSDSPSSGMEDSLCRKGPQGPLLTSSSPCGFSPLARATSPFSCLMATRKLPC